MFPQQNMSILLQNLTMCVYIIQFDLFFFFADDAGLLWLFMYVI